MKKAFSLAISTIFLSACSLAPTSSDGGVFRSDDGGKSFVQKVTVDEKTKISGADVLSMAVNPLNGAEVYIGTKSSGIFKTTDAGETWQPLKVSGENISKVYALSIDSGNPNILYAAAIVGGRGKIMKSMDAGGTWKETYSEPADGPFVLSLVADPMFPGRIFGGTTKGQIIYSENGGDTWRNLYETQGEVFKIAMDVANSNIVYFAVNQKGMVRTRDGGASFEDVGEQGFMNSQQLGNPTAILADPNRANWIYAGTTNGLFRSKNSGDDWELVKVLNRPDENSIRAIAINPQNSNEIMYGSAQAFYKSVDGGQSWSTLDLMGSRTIEAISYSRQNPAVIYTGMNKR